MNIGIPKERRAFEYRVGLFPGGVKMLTQLGHTVYVEHDAGLGAGFSDQEYIQAGARIVYTPHEVFGRADLLLKVARPLAEEIEWLRPGVALAGLLHLGSSRQDKIELLVENEITAIAYEQITLAGWHRTDPQAAQPDRRHPGGADRRPLAAKRYRRQGHPAGRYAGRASGGSGHYWRRGCRHGRSQGFHGHGRACHRAGHQHLPPWRRSITSFRMWRP